jgi:RNA polymerase sigma factor (TIGR02999 family)
VTKLLDDWNRGERAALDALMPLVYDELHKLAERYLRRERPGQTLQPTALVNEAYLRLVDQRPHDWHGRAHFVGVAAQLMRMILVDYCRRRRSQKRGAGIAHITFDEEFVVGPGRGNQLLALDDALNALARLDPRKSRVAEMRFFGGLSVEETAEALSVSQVTVMRDWRFAKAWLRRELA